MKKTFILNGVQVYDMPVEKLNLKPRDKKYLIGRGIMTALALQQHILNDIDVICKKEDGRIDFNLQIRLNRCLNASEYIRVGTESKYRPNDDWDIFVGKSAYLENGHIGYIYESRQHASERVMSYAQYIEIMKCLHAEFPKLTDMELVSKFQRSNMAEPYIRAMILRELFARSCSYGELREYAITFSTAEVFRGILDDMLKKHEIEEYVDRFHVTVTSNVLYVDPYYTCFALPGFQDVRTSFCTKIDFD